MVSKHNHRFNRGLYSHGDLKWKKDGRDRLVSNRPHGPVVFILGVAHRDACLRELNLQKREGKRMSTHLSPREKSALAAEL